MEKGNWSCEFFFIFAKNPCEFFFILGKKDCEFFFNGREKVRWLVNFLNYRLFEDGKRGKTRSAKKRIKDFPDQKKASISQ